MSNPASDPRLPASGTVLTREYKGKTINVTFTGTAFECDGETYKSLSALATKLTDNATNGFKFFGLVAKDKAPKTAKTPKAPKAPKVKAPKAPKAAKKAKAADPAPTGDEPVVAFVPPAAPTVTSPVVEEDIPASGSRRLGPPEGVPVAYL